MKGISIDWTDESKVQEFYDNIKTWNTRITLGDCKGRKIYEIKNNKVFYDGQYYLPIKSDPENRMSYGIPFDCKDGFMFGYVFTKHNDWYDNKDAEIVNLFYIEQLISQEDIDTQTKKLNNFKSLGTIEFLKILNLNRLNHTDLNLLKENFIKLFDKTLFPYITKHEKPVSFRFGDFDRIEVTYRNRKGYLEIDNGYHGEMPWGNDYSAHLLVAPYFTNEHYVYNVRVETQDLKFNQDNLDAIATRLIKVWDIAIEANSTNSFTD